MQLLLIGLSTSQNIYLYLISKSKSFPIPTQKDVTDLGFKGPQQGVQYHVYGASVPVVYRSASLSDLCSLYHCYLFCHCSLQVEAEFPVAIKPVILESKTLGDLHANVVTVSPTLCLIFNIPELKTSHCMFAQKNQLQ